MKNILRQILKYVVYFAVSFVLCFLFFHKDGIWSVLGYVLAMTLVTAVYDLIVVLKKNKKSE